MSETLRRLLKKLRHAGPKGEQATLEAEEGARRNCRNNRAKAIWENAKFRGADFQAVGNEPGWNLEISAGGEIVYVGDYGQSEYRFLTPDPVEEQDARRTTYTVEDRGSRAGGSAGEKTLPGHHERRVVRDHGDRRAGWQGVKSVREGGVALKRGILPKAMRKGIA